ncbi:unnamed protein product [Gongylonema pulchrum]|uniref:BPI2 domain-containing protein n=1 Tax=Gongylonema pulchrum TaxID=637853 RepID=A0A183DG85_9BILA|nr:unnamed protein product [Gongylonema pulchrum]
MDSTMYFMPAIRNRRIVGTVNNVTVMVREHDSKIGHFSPRLLEFLEKFLAESVKIYQEAVLKIGIPLPLLDLTVADNARFVTKNPYIRIDFDLVYS